MSERLGAKQPFRLWVCVCGVEVTAREKPVSKFCKCDGPPVYSLSDGEPVGLRLARLNRQRSAKAGGGR